MNKDTPSWLLLAVVAAAAVYFWSPWSPATVPLAPRPVAPADPAPVSPCPGPNCPAPERVYGAPAPLVRQARTTSPAWPVGRTLYHRTDALTTHFQANGTCTVWDGRRVFSGCWRRVWDHQVDVLYGHDWERDGEPCCVRYYQE